jgi:tRNA-Thr(GGU) m(6)t(6)A37 methyltransferase TsaA
MREFCLHSCFTNPFLEATMKTEFKLTQIGTVHARENGFALEIFPAYRAALNGLEGFSHINVLWWFHLLDTPQYRAVTECPKPYQHAPETLGIFATRSPVRPNPLALSVSQVVGMEQEKGLIYLTYIDAEDGTPIFDIKPYLPCTDRVREVQVPAWSAHWPQWYEDSAEFDWEAEFVNAQ